MAIHRKQLPACPIELTINAIAARWKAMIVYQLLQAEQCTYGQLRSLVHGITDRVLTTQLAELAHDRVLWSERKGRQVYYRLTESGRDLGPIFAAMRMWGEGRQREHVPDGCNARGGSR